MILNFMRRFWQTKILQEVYEKQKDKLTLNDIFFYTVPWWKMKGKFL